MHINVAAGAARHAILPCAAALMTPAGAAARGTSNAMPWPFSRAYTASTRSIGTLTSSLVHPREVFADAITDRAASIIVAHNHPSGTLTPSDAERQVTERLREAGELLGVALIDHILLTKTDFVRI